MKEGAVAGVYHHPLASSEKIDTVAVVAVVAVDIIISAKLAQFIAMPLKPLHQHRLPFSALILKIRVTHSLVQGTYSPGCNTRHCTTITTTNIHICLRFHFLCPFYYISSSAVFRNSRHASTGREE